MDESEEKPLYYPVCKAKIDKRSIFYLSTVEMEQI
jgi:hypothetical protein